jgi:hypothetical protein
MRRKRGERNFTGLRSWFRNAPACSPLPRKLERVLAKLEPQSDQHAFLGFLRNVDDAKALTGCVEDLFNAVTDYQVRVTYPGPICSEHPVRFQSNRE